MFSKKRIVFIITDQNKMTTNIEQLLFGHRLFKRFLDLIPKYLIYCVILSSRDLEILSCKLYTKLIIALSM